MNAHKVSLITIWASAHSGNAKICEILAYEDRPSEYFIPQIANPQRYRWGCALFGDPERLYPAKIMLHVGE